MNNCKIELVDTPAFYGCVQSGKATEDDFRYKVMKPVENMWNYLHAPLKAKEKNGYDVLVASEMLGIWTPRKSAEQVHQQFKALQATHIFSECQQVIELGLQQFTAINYEIPLEKIVVSILLGDNENPILMANKGYSGFGGIPGYILLFCVPNNFNKTRLKSALAHELNHNIRFTFEPFNHGDITVEDYLVLEGLAEVFAETLYGKERIGPWIQEFTSEEMCDILAIINSGRNNRGFEQVAAYMYGDEIAEKQGYQPVGLPQNAGYTVGYHIVKDFLKHTGKTIAEATLTSSEEIIKDSKLFE